MTQPDGKNEHYWNRANVIFAGVATLCAVVTAIYLVSDHQKQRTNSASTPTTTSSKQSADDPDPNQQRLLTGRWQGAPKRKPLPEHPGGSEGAMEMTESLDFQEAGVLTAYYSVAMSEFVVNRMVSVMCKGVAMGKWNLSSGKLLVRFDEALFVALDSATDGNVHLSGPQAEAKGFHCPDTPMIPRGYAVTQDVLELTGDSLRLQTIETTGQPEMSVYHKARE
jgi:hypothetical protein